MRWGGVECKYSGRTKCSSCHTDYLKFIDVDGDLLLMENITDGESTICYYAGICPSCSDPLVIDQPEESKEVLGGLF